MPGPNPSDNPDIDYTSLDAVLVLLANQEAWFAERARIAAIDDYLIRLQGWKNDNEQRIANKLPLNPPPVPPKGYQVPVVPTPPPPPPPDFTPLVGVKNQWGQYPAAGDNNPAGAIIVWNGLKLKRVVWPTPFGDSHWWEEVK